MRDTWARPYAHMYIDNREYRRNSEKPLFFSEKESTRFNYLLILKLIEEKTAIDYQNSQLFASEFALKAHIKR